MILRISLDQQTRHDDKVLIVIYDKDEDEVNPIGSLMVAQENAESWQNHLLALNKEKVQGQP